MLMVIFGAGASYDSCPTYPPGTPVPGTGEQGALNEWYRPPLAKDLFANRPMFIKALDEFPQCQAIVPRLRDPAVTGGQASIETRLQEIEEQARTYAQGPPEIAAIRCYLARAMSSCESSWRENTRGITNHLRLLREILRVHKPTTDKPAYLVTFNYDTLLEDALAHPHIGLEIKQMDDYTRRLAPFRFFKLHGSVNWGHEVDMRFPGNLNMTHPQSVKHLIEHATPQQITNRFAICHPSSMGLADGRNPVFPAIAIPVEKKQVFECPEYMIEELKRTLHDVTKLLVIGWRATEDHFLDLLNKHLQWGRRPHVSIVSADGTQAKETGARIHAALQYSSSSSAESAAGFTEFMRSDRLQEILGG